MWAFAKEAAAWFIGTGAAVIALRYLADTAAGHWLAKGLAKYTASLETQELPKRVAIERIDRQRAKFIARLMEKVSRWHELAMEPITGAGLPVGVGAETVLLRHYGNLTKALREITFDVASSTYLFPEKDRLVELAFAWSSHMHALADALHDNVVKAVADDNYWKLPEADRWLAMRDTQGAMIAALGPDSEISGLLARCRDYTHPKS